MKDYLQPAATFALALAIASLPLTLTQTAKANRGEIWGTIGATVTHLNSCVDP